MPRVGVRGEPHLVAHQVAARGAPEKQTAAIAGAVTVSRKPGTGCSCPVRTGNPSRLDRCKLILETLEEHHGHKGPTAFAAATIEHIMPVTLTDEWRAMLGEKAEDVHALHLHTIGNLTLTGYNSELSNSPFAKKKALLADSHFELNKYFAGQATWGDVPILARSKALWERARQIWPGPGE